MIQRNVYEIIVLESKGGKILNDSKVTATSSESALAKIDIKRICEETKCTPDDTELVILKLGSLRPVQEVMSKEVSSF